MGIITGISSEPPRAILGIHVHALHASVTLGSTDERLTDGEMVIMILLFITGALVWAYVLASFVDIIINIQPERKEFRNALDSLNRFLHIHNIHQDNPKLCVQVCDETV